MWPIKLNLVAGFTRAALFIIVHKARAQVGLGNGQSGREVYAKSRWFIYSEFSRIAVGTNNQRSKPLFTYRCSHIIRDWPQAVPPFNSLTTEAPWPVTIGPLHGSKVTPLHLFISTSFRKQFRIRWHRRGVFWKSHLFLCGYVFYLEKEACRFKRG